MTSVEDVIQNSGDIVNCSDGKRSASNLKRLRTSPSWEAIFGVDLQSIEMNLSLHVPVVGQLFHQEEGHSNFI